TLKRRISAGRCAMFLGIRHPGHRRAFIIHVPKEVAPLPEALPQSRGFLFDVLIAGDEERTEDLSIILSAARPDYHEVFAAICDDLFTKIDGQTGTREVVKTFLNRVRLWQLFFEKQAGAGLSDEAQKGLFGELYFLQRLVLPRLPEKDALHCWMGGADRQHDFQFGS